MYTGIVLVVDDSAPNLAATSVVLMNQGYTVDAVRNGVAAVERVREKHFDLVVLAMNIADIGGIEACRAIRQESAVAIIAVAGPGADSHRIEALDAGADAFVTRPYEESELLAHVRASLRRTHGTRGPTGKFTVGAVEVDFDTRRIAASGRQGTLTPKEFDLLCYMVMHSNKVLSHRELLQAVWGRRTSSHVEYLRVFVNQLRSKIEPTPSRPIYLLTAPGVGYWLRLPSDRNPNQSHNSRGTSEAMPASVESAHV